MKKIALLSLSAIFLSACTIGGISIEQAETTAADFIKILAPGAEVTIKSVEKFAGGDFKITVDANGQEIISYLSPDGTTFYPQGLDIVDLTTKAAEFQKAQETGELPVAEEEATEVEAGADTETMPVEEGNGIGDGAESLDEVLEETTE